MQHNAKTIQGEFMEVTRQLFSSAAEVFSGEPTVAGVHAVGQTVHLKVPELKADIKPAQILKEFNELLPPDINIIRLTNAPDTFHARKDALGQQIAGIMQDDLKSIGVKMEIQVLEWATYMERTRKHEFQANTAAWGPGTDPDTSYNLWHSSSYDPKGDAGRNYGGYKNARVDELFEMGRREFDQAKRAEIYGEMHSLIYEDQPYTFLFNRPIIWGIHERIHGVTSSPRGVFSFTPSVDAWWVRPADAKHVTASVP